MEKITSIEMRRMNREKIYRLIYSERRIARTDIAHRLRMSLPTVTQNLKALEDMGLIDRNGVFQSTGGRKPQVITCIGDVRVSIGVEIARDYIHLVAVDIYGVRLCSRKVALRYEDSERYYSRFGRKVFAFCDAAELPRDRILGVGIAIQGSPTPDGTQVMHGRILLDTGLRVENFARHLNLPCRLIHDVKAAALAELWSSDSIQNALFLFLGQYLGGILILGRNIIGEKTVSGTDVLGGFIEHMTLYPGGDDCYCGRKGCVSAYCSGYTLLDGSQASLDSFFAGLHSGNKSAMRKWKAFLDSLAIATGSMHMMMNCDIILGGSISPFLRDDDIERLKSKMHGCEKLPLSDFFVKRAQTNGEGVACGAALPFIEQFLHSIFL